MKTSPVFMRMEGRSVANPVNAWDAVATPLIALAKGIARSFSMHILPKIVGGYESNTHIAGTAHATDADQAPLVGTVCLVGAGAGRSDLITLRGVKRIQEADIIFHDRLIDEELLNYASADAERVCVGKVPGAREWPQERISALLVSAARQGKRIVRLKCGDPGVFARGADEAHCLTAAGIPFEIVPGVTAASVAAASAGAFLTERGKTDTLVLSTGACQPGDLPPDFTRHLHAGTTLALYMSVSVAPTIQRTLLAAGYPASLPVEIVANADRPNMRIERATLETLEAAMKQGQIANPAMIFIRFPKSHAARASVHAAA